MNNIARLLAIAHTYGMALGLEMSAVSWRVFRDSKKIAAIEAGADIQIRRYECAIQWFSDHWPADTPWPAGIERPQQQQEAPQCA